MRPGHAPPDRGHAPPAQRCPQRAEHSEREHARGGRAHSARTYEIWGEIECVWTHARRRDGEAEPNQHLTPIINLHVVSCLEEKRGSAAPVTSRYTPIMCTLLLASTNGELMCSALARMSDLA